jgi:hypothetical protein
MILLVFDMSLIYKLTPHRLNKLNNRTKKLDTDRGVNREVFMNNVMREF